MNTTKEVLNYLIEQGTIRNQQQFAEKIGTDAGVISLIINEKKRPTADFFRKVESAFPEISLGWLVSGEGEMLKSTPVMGIKERTLQILEAKRMRKADFERKCGFVTGYTNYISDNMTCAKLECILNAFPDIDRTWLMTGEGSMYKGGSTDNTATELVEENENLKTENQNLLQENTELKEVAEKANARVEQMQERIDKMLSIIERQQNTIENLTDRNND